MIGLVGHDPAGGLGVTRCCAPFPSMGLAISAGQGAQITLPLADLPSGWNTSMAAVLFILPNGGSQAVQAKFSYIDERATVDFNDIIYTNPLYGANSFSTTLLQAATTDPYLGGRLPVQGTWNKINFTTGGVDVERQFAQITFTPDIGPDFPAATVRAASIRFDSLLNSIQDIIRSAGGNYIEIVDGASKTIRLGQASLQFVTALLKGNNAIKLYMPVDQTGFAEQRLYLGNLTVNQSGFTEQWRKTSQVPVHFQFVPAAQDGLLICQNAEIMYEYVG